MANLTDYEGREQAAVKHSLLEKYLPQWVYRVGREWEKLVYVDGFAGPWQVVTEDCSDSSFGRAVLAMKRAADGMRVKWKRPVTIQSVLVATTKPKQAVLETFAARHRGADFLVETERGEFADRVTDILAKIGADRKRAFRFVFLDPKGWAQIPMQGISSFLQARSSEVLITLMTSFIKRFLDEPDRAASYKRLFGRDDALNSLQTTPADFQQEQVVLEYGISLKKLCGYEYVACAAVLRPDREEVLYYLVFGTNHPKGIEVFKDAEMHAAKLQDQVRIEKKARKEGVMELNLDGDGQKTQCVIALRTRNLNLARARIYAILLADQSKEGVPYSRLFCEAMFYPLVTPHDLQSWIDDSPAGCVRFVLDGSRRRVASPSQNDRVYVVDRDVLSR